MALNLRRTNFQYKNGFAWVVASVFILICAFRGDTRDTQVYIDIFNASWFPLDPISYYDEFSVEFGYGVLSSLVKVLGLNYKYFFAIISFSTFYCIYKSAHLLRLPFLHVLLVYLPLYFVPQQLMQIRQGLAIPLVFLFIILFVKFRSLIQQLSYFIVAASLHLVTLPLFLMGLFIAPIARSEINYRLLSSFVFILIFFISLYAISLSGVVLSFEKVQMYASIDEFSESRSFFELANIRNLTMGFVFLYFLLKYPSDSFIVFLALLYFISLIIRFVFSDFSIIGSRFGSAFGFAEIFLVPIIIRYYFSSEAGRILCCIAYFLIQGSASLFIAYPYVLDDYLRPLI